MSEENKRENEAAEAAEKRAAEAPEAANAENAEAVKSESAETAKAESAETAQPAEAKEAAPQAAAPEAAAPEAAPAETSKPAGKQAEEAKPEATAPAPAQAAAEGEAPRPRRQETEEEKAARRKAALEARERAKAAAAQARAGGQGAPAAGSEGGAEAEPKPPSPNQPRLDRAAAIIREQVAEDAVEEAYINEPNGHLPTLVIKNEHWLKAAQLFRDHEELKCAYLRNITGVDHETHMEVVYFPLNMEKHEMYCIKVRADREQPKVPSVTGVWETANWQEREIYDLLGIEFPGHPNLARILLPDDWVGHPLRKDYVPLDPEV